MEPSVDPLSEITTSPRIPSALKALKAWSTQNAMDCTSLRQGITMETSGRGGEMSVILVPACSETVMLAELFNIFKDLPHSLAALSPEWPATLDLPGL